MQVILRCRCLLISGNSINFSTTQFASLHSTTACNEKRKNSPKCNFTGGQQPSKNSIRIVTRLKRRDAKKALWSGFISNYGESATPFQNDQRSSKACNSKKKCDTETEYRHSEKIHIHSSKKKGHSKAESCEKIHKHNMRRKFRKGYISEDDYTETLYEATFGNKWHAWYSEKSTHEFKWKDSFHYTSDHHERGTSNEPDSDDEAFNVGSRSDRAALGLPQSGPLKLKDVKTAFHLSALRWHPDKHQGSAQAVAEEKFKLCVSAYQSLCSALSGT